MTPLDQADFAGAILDGERPFPSGLSTWDGSDPGQRFAVYRNNVVVSLVDALGGRFPIARRVLGGPFFDAMAGLYVRARPPASRLLHEYGDDLPAFAERFEPARPVPYLADLLRLEAARTRAWHAADASWLDAAGFADALSGPVSDLRVQLHPSLLLFRSRFPVVSIWQAHQADSPVTFREIDLEVGETALVVRPDLEVETHAVPAGLASLIQALSAGARVGVAVGEAFAAEPAFEVTGGIAKLMTLRVVTRIVAGGEAR